MSRPFVELYIDDKKVEFKEPPEIFITYAHTDLHNPSVVKNSFSKTVTVDGTPENNKIFGCFFDNKRISSYSDHSLSGAYFNPNRKVSFTLYRNGEPMETGYVKLDKVKRNGNNIQYDITLYGGLGQFLYNLQYKEDGEEMKLSDLDFGGGEKELDMVLTKETIRDAWLHITKSRDVDDVYDLINFAPCYNGIPKDFTADKVAIDANSFRLNNPQLYNQFTVSTDEGYGLVDGWCVGELGKEYDEWQMKDLRSYFQRPVIRFKNIIQSCCAPKNNGGYYVDLDEDFFNAENPYYENAWMTLPLYSELANVEPEKVKDAVFKYTTGRIVVEGCDTGNTYNFSIPFSLNITVDDASSSSLSSSVYIYCSGKYKTGNSSGTASAAITDYGTVYYAQLVAYKADGTAVAGSQIMVFGGTQLNHNSYLEGMYKFTPVFNTSYEKKFAQWERQSDGTYMFDGVSNTLTINNLEYRSGMYFRVVLKEAENIYGSDNYTDLKSVFYPKTEYIWTDNSITGPSDCQELVDAKKNAVSVNGQATVNVSTDGYVEQTYYTKERKLNKRSLLNSEHTPCDYFLSYLKMFNLHIWKDMYEDIIYVRKRGNFFINDKYDIEDVVDRGDDINITPLTFENKWLTLEYETEESKLSEDYKDEFGIDYGIQKVNTNFNFDNSSKNILEKNVFKSCITARQRSRYYVDIYQSYEDDDVYYPPFCLDGFQTFLFNASGDTTEGSYITPKTSQQSISWWEQKYYDILPKPTFIDDKNEPIDGSNVLLFYNGTQMMEDVDGNRIRFSITDDIPQFEDLNEGEPCWIWSMDWDVAITTINNFPSFSRYITNENGWITHSWDFGTPKYLYIPDYSIDDSSNIYTQYWQPYIRDMYNVDTRVVECRVLLKERVIGDWLRRFYYFDGSYWILNKIADYDVTSNGTTKCEFVRVNDIRNYLQ